MKFGIASRPSGDFCANCNKPVENKDGKENFCSYCGVPLNSRSLDIRESEYMTVKLETLEEIERRIDSEPIEKIVKDMKKRF